MRRLLNILFIALCISPVSSTMLYSSIKSAQSASCFKDNERFCATIDILSSNELGKRLIERINEYLYKSSKNLIN